jgi:hypothetical protein
MLNTGVAAHLGKARSVGSLIGSGGEFSLEGRTIARDFTHEVMRTTYSAVSSELHGHLPIANNFDLRQRTIIFKKPVRTWNTGAKSNLPRDDQRIRPTRELIGAGLNDVNASLSKAATCGPRARERTKSDTRARSRAAQGDDPVEIVPVESAMPAAIGLEEEVKIDGERILPLRNEVKPEPAIFELYPAAAL